MQICKLTAGTHSLIRTKLRTNLSAYEPYCKFAKWMYVFIVYETQCVSRQEKEVVIVFSSIFWSIFK